MIRPVMITPTYPSIFSLLFHISERISPICYVRRCITQRSCVFDSWFFRPSPQITCGVYFAPFFDSFSLK